MPQGNDFSQYVGGNPSTPPTPASAQTPAQPQPSWLDRNFGMPALENAYNTYKTYYEGMAKDIHVPFEPSWNDQLLRSYLPSWAGGESVQAQNQNLKVDETKHPLAAKIGEFAGNMTPGIAAGEGVGALWDLGVDAVGGIGPSEEYLTGAPTLSRSVANIAKGTAVGAVSGAASSNHPLTGAEYGAITGGALSGVLEGAGAGVRLLSRNTPYEMQQVADTGDTLLQNTQGLKRPGIKEVMGVPNLTGEQTLQNTPYVSKVVNAPVIKHILGVAGSAAKKVASGDVAAARAATGDGDWFQTLENEPAFQTQEGKLALHDPTKFGQYYPQLSDAGKKAALRGMIDNSLSVLKNGQYDLPKLNDTLKTMISQVGNQVGEDGLGGKWTLVGLQKLTDAFSKYNVDPELRAEIAAKAGVNPSGIQKILGIGGNILHGLGVGGGIAFGAGALADPEEAIEKLSLGLLHSPTLGHLVGGALAYRAVNTALDSPVGRDALIAIAKARTPSMLNSAIGAFTSYAMHSAHTKIQAPTFNYNPAPSNVSGNDFSQYVGGNPNK